MKTLLKTTLLFVLLAAPGSHAWAHHIYYWVVGAGDWHTLSNWRVDHTGMMGQINRTAALALPAPDRVPSNADDVYFNTAGFSGTPTPWTVTVGSPATAGSINWSGLTVRPALAINAQLLVSRSVTIGSPVLLTANAPFSVGRSLTISSGASSTILTINQEVTIGGSLTLVAAGNVAGTTGSLIFNGTTPTATIQPAGATFNVPITFNSANRRWTLQGSNMTVTQRVTFSQGYVEAPTTSRMLIFNGTAAEPVDASHNSHVIGFVQKRNLSAPMEMPVGAGSGMYRPVVARPRGGATDVTARYFNASPATNANPVMPPDQIAPVSDANPTPQLTSVSNREYWYVAGSNASLRIDLNYNRPNVAGENPSSDQYYWMNDPARRATLAIAGWTNSGWADINLGQATVIDPVNRTIMGVGPTGQVRYFTIGSSGSSPLPVRLVAFSAGQLDGRVQLKWQSASEENTSHFEVEKSADGKNFFLVLTKKAQGNSASLVSYNAVDNHPLGGTSYYRLRMVDLDGTFEYSRLVSVNAEGTLLVKVYPNPSKGNSVNLIAGNGSKLVLKAVNDLFGKQVSYQVGSSSAEGLLVSFTHPLPAGFYVATLAGSDNGQVVKVKFVVQ